MLIGIGVNRRSRIGRGQLSHGGGHGKRLTPVATKQPFRVIKVLSPRCILIDAGSDSGLSEDQVVKILRPGVEVIHPESNENLGRVESLLAMGYVHHVQEQFSMVGGSRVRVLFGLEVESIGGDIRRDPPFIHVKVGDLAVLYQPS